MKTSEEAILLAVLDDDLREAVSLVRGVLPGEREALASAAARIAELCAGAGNG